MSPRGRLVRSLLVGALGGLVVIGCSGGGGGGAVAKRSSRVPGFGEVAFQVGDGAHRCALLADTPDQQTMGLTGRTDLAGYDGMLFRFPDDTSASFWMKDTPMPLSIAWFDAGGAFVAATDMDPCLERASCPVYAPPRSYRYALEVPKGALGRLGIGPGARFKVSGACRS